MKTSMNKGIGLLLVWTTLSVVGLSWAPAHGDDRNPPPYRGEPLSVHAHWLVDPSGLFVLSEFSWADDDDPSTYLSPLTPSVLIDPAAGVYGFEVPNFVDELPIKLLRIQLTWTGTTQPPLFLASIGIDGGNAVPGVVTFASTPLVFTQPPGGYQYFDIEYKPNPDFEQIRVQLPPDVSLDQVVIDSISTVPEPAASGLLIWGGMGITALRRRRYR